MVYIRLGKELSRLQIPASNRQKLRSHPTKGGRPILLAVNDLKTSIHIRRHTLNHRDLSGNRLSVAEHKRACATRAVANTIAIAAAGFYPDKIVAKAFQLVFDSAGPGVADRDHANECSHTNGDPQNGKYTLNPVDRKSVV